MRTIRNRLFGVVGACLLAAAPFLREKLLRLQVSSSHSEATDKAFGVVISFTGIVLAFLLVQPNINFRNLETQVGTEAHNLSQLDRLIIRYGDSANVRRTKKLWPSHAFKRDCSVELRHRPEAYAALLSGVGSDVSSIG